MATFKDGTSVEQAASLDQLRRNKERTLADPSYLDHLQQVIDQASLGNPALAQQDLTTNCGILQNFEATPAP